jgi:hypothetical protein
MIYFILQNICAIKLYMIRIGSDDACSSSTPEIMRNQISSVCHPFGEYDSP